MNTALKLQISYGICRNKWNVNVKIHPANETSPY